MLILSCNILPMVIITLVLAFAQPPLYAIISLSVSQVLLAMGLFLFVFNIIKQNSKLEDNGKQNDIDNDVDSIWSFKIEIYNIIKQALTLLAFSMPKIRLDKKNWHKRLDKISWHKRLDKKGGDELAVIRNLVVKIGADISGLQKGLSKHKTR